MKSFILISIIGSCLLFGCEQEGENVPNLSINFEEDKRYTEENLNGLLLQMRKKFASDMVDFEQEYWNLRDLKSKDYWKLKAKINRMADQYQMGFKYGNLKDSIAADIEKFAHEFIKNKKPILLIYGPYSDSLAERHNAHSNELNLKFVGCRGSYTLPASNIRNNEYKCGKKLRLNTSYNEDLTNLKYQNLNNIYRLIAFQKFNETTISTLFKKYGSKKVNRILNRNLN